MLLGSVGRSWVKVRVRVRVTVSVRRALVGHRVSKALLGLRVSS